MKGKLKFAEKGKGVWRKERECGVEKWWRVGERKTRELETRKSIELKRFLDTDFTTKNYFRALNLRLGYRFHHLIKIKTHLNTTLIGLIRDKQVENSK